MWWLYFSVDREHFMEEARSVFEQRAGHDTFIWGYGHWFVLGSIAAVGAGIAVLVDQQTHHAEISERTAVLSVALPLAIYLVSVWAVHHKAGGDGPRTLTYLGGTVVVLALGLLAAPLWAMGVVTAAMVAQTVVSAERGAKPPAEA
ncbi:hypothetical protein B7486_71585 [cyanobacterium TDX16]|nr:hypothetical protein B7486_71585 [cyanobacterium TDX16]